jgi:TolB-like protein/DNA-binding winged helix-turn-helix (wHTH) protein
MNPENSLKLPGEPETAAASSGQPRLIRFDRYMLDLRRGTLRVGEDDIEIRPKTFEVLKLLVENAGRLVSKDEIVAAVWSGVFVTDDSVVQCIKELRRALGPDGERLVRTVPRRGYRLEADGPTDLSTTPPDFDARRADGQPGSMAGAVPRHSHGHLGLAAAAGFAALLAICLFPDLIIQRALPQGGKPAIAVLPFTSAREDGDQLADGMTNDIINALGRFPSLTVMSHSAVALYKHRSATPQQVGRDLSVRYVLEGSVRRLGDQLRVTAELADTDRGEVLWSGRFDETPDGVFDVQDRIATEVVDSLAIKVMLVEQAVAPATESPKSASAKSASPKSATAKSATPKPTSHQSASPASPPAVIAMRDDSAAPLTTPAAANGRLTGLDAADMQRVTAIAAENKFILPSFVINRPAATVPPQLRRYSGIWASKIAFNGGTGRHTMLIVTDVEGDGTIMGYFVYGPPTPQTVEQSPAGFVQWLGKVSDGALTYQYALYTMTVQLTLDNIFLVQNRTDGRRATVTMEPVWRLADEERAAARRAE